MKTITLQVGGGYYQVEVPDYFTSELDPLIRGNLTSVLSGNPYAKMPSGTRLLGKAPTKAGQPGGTYLQYLQEHPEGTYPEYLQEQPGEAYGAYRPRTGTRAFQEYFRQPGQYKDVWSRYQDVVGKLGAETGGEALSPLWADYLRGFNWQGQYAGLTPQEKGLQIGRFSPYLRWLMR